MASTEQTREGFITQTLSGDYRSFSEDRLTQLAAASFNHSRVFRACFLRFLRARNANRTLNARAETQRPVWRNGERGRLDLVITRGHRTLAIVENKVDAPLHARQLKFYSGVPEIKSSKKIALVRHYFEARGIEAGWRIQHWRDFYLILRECVDGPKAIPLIDRFVIRNFIEFLEAANMHTPTRISKRDMKDLARMLHGIRYPSKTRFRWISPKGAVFETAADWMRMMESVFNESRLVPKLTKAARKRYRFKPGISHWRDGEGKKKTYPWIGLHWEIWFPKPRGRTKAVGLGLFVDETAKWNIDAYRHVTGSDNIESRTIVDGRGDVVLTKMSKAVLQKWQKWLP